MNTFDNKIMIFNNNVHPDPPIIHRKPGIALIPPNYTPSHVDARWGRKHI